MEYIGRLENQLLDYNRRKHFGKLRCNAVDDEKHCENVAVKRVLYRGDPQIYKKKEFQRLFLSFYVKSITKEWKVNN